MDWLANTWNELKEFLWSIVLSVHEMQKDIGIFFFEQFLDITQLALNGMDSYFDGLNISSYTSMIPPDVSWFLGQIGVTQALTMIVTAITIRIILQLIPFTRLGS